MELNDFLQKLHQQEAALRAQHNLQLPPLTNSNKTPRVPPRSLHKDKPSPQNADLEAVLAQLTRKISISKLPGKTTCVPYHRMKGPIHASDRENARNVEMNFVPQPRHIKKQRKKKLSGKSLSPEELVRLGQLPTHSFQGDPLIFSPVTPQQVQIARKLSALPPERRDKILKATTLPDQFIPYSAKSNEVQKRIQIHNRSALEKHGQAVLSKPRRLKRSTLQVAVEVAAENEASVENLAIPLAKFSSPSVVSTSQKFFQPHKQPSSRRDVRVNQSVDLKMQQAVANNAPSIFDMSKIQQALSPRNGGGVSPHSSAISPRLSGYSPRMSDTKIGFPKRMSPALPKPKLSKQLSRSMDPPSPRMSRESSMLLELAYNQRVMTEKEAMSHTLGLVGSKALLVEEIKKESKRENKPVRGAVNALHKNIDRQTSYATRQASDTPDLEMIIQHKDPITRHSGQVVRSIAEWSSWKRLRQSEQKFDQQLYQARRK